MVFIISRAKVPVQILPVAITGTADVFPALKKLRRVPARVTIGQPFFLPQSVGKPDLPAMTDFAMRKLAEILPDEMRGVYRY